MNKRILISLAIIALLASGVAFAMWHSPQNESSIAESEDDDDFQFDSEEQRELAETENTPEDIPEESGSNTSGGGVIEEPYEGNVSEDGVDSNSGRLTLQSPAPGATVGNGDTLQGTATTDEVHYRIVDHERGVISQGQLSVSNGGFSGKLDIRPYGSRGSIEIYTFDDATGQETDRVEIEVKFRQ